ncbi:MAG: hypothetical protein AAF357_05995, partial [Verrucomicrobiota bacterium]
ASSRTGRYEIWAVDLASGRERQITRNGGSLAALAPDPDYLLVSKKDAPGLWQVALDGSGSESLFIEETDNALADGWEVVGDYLYYMTIVENDRIAIRRRTLPGTAANMTEETVLYLSHQTYDGYFDVAGDHSHVLYSKLTRYSGQLYRVDLAEHR